MADPTLASYRLGERVKVKGQMEAGGWFRALEVVRREGKPHASLQGTLEAVDVDAGRVRVLQQDLCLHDDAAVKDLMGDRVELTALVVGDAVKVKGPVREGRLEPRRLKSKESLGFDLDEIQGGIETLDPEAGHFRVAGIEIRVCDETAFRG